MIPMAMGEAVSRLLLYFIPMSLRCVFSASHILEFDHFTMAIYIFVGGDSRGSYGRGGGRYASSLRFYCVIFLIITKQISQNSVFCCSGGGSGGYGGDRDSYGGEFENLVFILPLSLDPLMPTPHYVEFNLSVLESLER